MNREYRELALRLQQMEERLDGLAGSQLRHSSLEDAAVPEYDAMGKLVSIWGRQADGTHGIVPVNGPPPPIPTGITFKPEAGGAWVRWAGEWEAPPPPTDPDVVPSPAVAPLDFSHVEVHASTEPGFSGLMFDTLVSRITGPRGGSTFVPMPRPEGATEDPDYYVRLVARTTSGKSSVPSLPVGPIRAGKVGVTDLGFDLDEIGGSKISYGPDEPVDPQIGNLWYAEVGQDPETGQFLYESRRYVGEVEGWKPVESQRVHDALATAVEAQIEAESAGLGALAANNLAKKKSRWETGTIAPTPTAEEDAGTAVLWWVDAGAGNQIKTWDGTTDTWKPYRLGNGAIEPKSLIARDVVATGTISAALFEAVMVLASVLIAGNPSGFHVRIDKEGVRVYRLGPDGAVVQSGQFGGGGALGDFMSGGRDEHGNPLWAADESGTFSMQGLFVSGDPIFMGRPFTQWVSASSGSGNGQPEIYGAKHQIGWAAGGLNGITSEVGIFEMAVDVSKDRWYWVGFDVGYRRQETNEIALRIRDGGTGSPSIGTSPEIMKRTITDGQVGATNTAFRMGIWYPTVTGKHRIGLTAATQAGGITDVLNEPVLPAMIVIDMGPRKPIVASVNRMGGGLNPPPPPVAPTQQHYRDIPAGAWAAYLGSGAPHGSATGPVQGYSPYAASNGNAKGHWTFNLPSITGTIDRIDFYVYTEHWHFDTGGTAIFNIAITGNPYVKPKPDWFISGYPKPGEKTITLPSDWYPFFRDSGANGFARADGITVGSPLAGTDPLYYGRFSGTRAALRIWYTQ